MAGSIYETMSPIGKAVAEFLELSVRHDVLRRRERTVPGFKMLAGLVAELQARLRTLGLAEQDAIASFRAGSHRPGWDAWVRRHLAEHPGDAPGLFLVERYFSPHTRPVYAPECGPQDRPWQMEHKW